MKFLNAREWLEHERTTGLPHADFAADALVALNEYDDLSEADDLLRDQINQATGDVVENSDQIVEAFRWRDAVLTALTDAGVIDDDVPVDRVGPLLRMFLPSMGDVG